MTPAYRVTKKYWEGRRFCSPACRIAGTAGARRSTFGKTKVSLEKRFWGKVSKKGDDECWPWTGKRDIFGYGIIRPVRQSDIRAHRLSYELHYGPIPEGLSVCHRCDNPCCVNPAHLFVGTHQENMADMAAKGRQVFQRRPERATHGEQHYAAKLDSSSIVAIRQRRENGEQLDQIARSYGVSKQTIWRAVHRKTWKHVE